MNSPLDRHNEGFRYTRTLRLKLSISLEFTTVQLNLQSDPFRTQLKTAFNPLSKPPPPPGHGVVRPAGRALHLRTFKLRHYTISDVLVLRHQSIQTIKAKWTRQPINHLIINQLHY